MANRPLTLDEYIGQDRIKMQLRITMNASKKNNTAMPHILFSGNSGLGKTTLAEIIANEFGTKLHVAMGGNLQSADDIQALLYPLSDTGGDIVFIDEIHRLPVRIEERLYTAMEDYQIELDNGYGLERFWIPKFTLVGATTISGELSRPLRDRFGLKLQLQTYQLDEIAKIITKLSEREKITINRDAINEIAKRSKGVARISINYLQRCKEFADYLGNGTIDGEIALQQFTMMGIDEIGLDESDLKVLEYLAGQSRPVGLGALCTGCDLDKPTVENIIEPYLAQVNMINRTSRGREITERGLSWLGIKPEVTQQNGSGEVIQRLGRLGNNVIDAII